ncbi:MAG: ATP-dependent Clp protease proteolytic subunit [Candidatus Eremiobacteraeota bacterium]|nr:ATP-dependent Clp protease proteolytic subunit [Candidatus Eremiobacteraeota bacterium]
MLNLRTFRLGIFAAAIAAGTFGMLLAASAQGDAKRVMLVPIDGQIDEGMAHMVDRSVAEAERDGDGAVVLDVNTLGGLVTSGTEIRDSLLASRLPTIAYVSERAISAGALVTLSAKHIVMAPGSTFGAAEPIPKTVKTVSFLRGEFASTALRNHRDPALAAAMVDATTDAPPYKRSGSILTLTAEDAKRAGMADAIAPTLGEALADTGFGGAQVQKAEYTFAEQIARFATNAEISGLLLSIGMLGLLIEMQTLHGIAGAIGVGAFALFFGTHVYAGFSNGLVIVLALLGVIGILFELHVVPGHGAPGILGGIALLLAVLLAFGIPLFFIALQTIAWSILLTIFLFWLATRAFPENAFMRRLTFAGVQGPEYVASRDFSDLRGKSGSASSLLRPAGVATIDGRRVDVLTDGDFIAAGTPIRVTRVEGARVFVEPVALPNYKE